jgi:hypothetical protein
MEKQQQVARMNLGNARMRIDQRKLGHGSEGRKWTAG